MDPWHSEIEESVYKYPDADIRECCLAIAFGDLDALRCDVHRGDFHGRYELAINFCPHCGRDMKEYRRIVLKKLAEKYLVPGVISEERGEEIDPSLPDLIGQSRKGLDSPVEPENDNKRDQFNNDGK